MVPIPPKTILCIGCVYSSVHIATSYHTHTVSCNWLIKMCTDNQYGVPMDYCFFQHPPTPLSFLGFYFCSSLYSFVQLIVQEFERQCKVDSVLKLAFSQAFYHQKIQPQWIIYHILYFHFSILQLVAFCKTLLPLGLVDRCPSSAKSKHFGEMALHSNPERLFVSSTVQDKLKFYIDLVSHV